MLSSVLGNSFYCARFRSKHRIGLFHSNSCFSLPWGVLSLASDYIIARLGCAVNHYLSFDKRGATAFQVLLPRQLSTYFATWLRSILPRARWDSWLSLNPFITFYSPLVVTFAFWPSSAIVLPSKSERLPQWAKPGLAWPLSHGNSHARRCRILG